MKMVMTLPTSKMSMRKMKIERSEDQSDESEEARMGGGRGVGVEVGIWR